VCIANSGTAVHTASLVYSIVLKWKKALRETQHCTLAVVRRSQKFSPRRRPLPWGAGRPKLISWRWSLPSPTDPVWWRSMHTVSSYSGNRPTNTQTHRQDRLQYNAPQLARSVINQISAVPRGRNFRGAVQACVHDSPRVAALQRKSRLPAVEPVRQQVCRRLKRVVTFAEGLCFHRRSLVR